MAEEQRLVGLRRDASRRSGVARADSIVGFLLGIAVLAAIMARVGAGPVPAPTRAMIAASTAMPSKKPTMLSARDPLRDRWQASVSRDSCSLC
jgi:hypothetical protein